MTLKPISVSKDTLSLYASAHRMVRRVLECKLLRVDAAVITGVLRMSVTKGAWDRARQPAPELGKRGYRARTWGGQRQ